MSDIKNSTHVTEKSTLLSEIRRIFLPIERHEYRKFLPMSLMMFCILFNYAALRSMKDSFVVTYVGAEALGFIKLYIVSPLAVLAMLIYVKLCDVLKRANVFYVITLFFLIYLMFFTFFIYPYSAWFHPSGATIAKWSAALPWLQWPIRVVGIWSFAFFYAMAELWGTLMLSLLFWQFANQITKTEEAKRFYGLFGILGNMGLIFVKPLDKLTQLQDLPKHLASMPLLCVVMVSVMVLLVTYRWMQNNVLTDPVLYDPARKIVKKKKVKLSFAEGLKVILTSRYICLIAVLVFAYGVSINLVEGMWKAKISQLYPTVEGYKGYMLTYQQWLGVVTILVMLIGNNILRRVSWLTAAMVTPIMLLVTGIAFFVFIFLENTIALHCGGLLVSGPLVAAVAMGTLQNVLSKASKYSFFDATKNMAYIPIDPELQTKGQAAVEVVGSRLGKSGGAFIQSTFLTCFPAFTTITAAPYFACIFFITLVVWIYAVRVLDKAYQACLQVSS